MRSQETITLTGSATAKIPAASVTIPRELGSVRLLREIGRGGMGVVYLGRHQMLDRDVAVKFLLNAVVGPDDPGFAGFLEGARAAARLEHPGLTTIHHADMIDGIPYLVMQYIDGSALSDVVRKTGPLSLSASFAVLDAVSEAIGELHDRGIIHRDIKPGNVLLSRDGRVVVTDFGLSLARPMGKRGPSSARLGGTPAYMAPEMFASELSLQSDVYALGIMTFELVTGELPYTGTLEEMREKHLHEPLPLQPLQRRRLDPAMIEVLERATHKNAMFRYKTARQFLRALRDAISGSEAWSKGAAELSALVAHCRTEPTEAKPPESGSSSSNAYLDTLATVAAGKRRVRPQLADAHHDVPEPLSSTMSPRYRRLSRFIPEVALFETDEQRKAAMRRASSITARGSGRLWIWVLFFFITLGITPFLMSVTGLDVEWGRLQTKYPIVRLIYGPLMVLLMYSWLWFCRSVIRPRLREQLVAKGVPICVPCGYNLRGQVDPRCPECGTAFDEKLLSAARIVPKTTPTSTYFDQLSKIAEEKRDTRERSSEGDAHEPTQDDRAEAPPLSPPNEPVVSGSISRERPTQAATLVADVSCVKCGYDLRGLSPGGRCPECSEAVASSLGPQRLMFAPGSWLAGSAAGLTVIIWALGIGVPLTICLVRIGIAVGQRALLVEVIDRTRTVRLPPNVYLGISSAAILTTFVAFVTGLFMATRREPQVRFARDTDTIRRAARILLILFPVTFALLQFFPLPTLSDALQFRPELAMLLLGLSVLSFVHYLAVLAARIPDSRLALRSRLIVLAVVVLLALSVIPGLFGLVGNFVPVALVPTIVAVFVLSIWFRRAFRCAAASSASYETLFGDVATEVALASAEIKTNSTNERKQTTIPTTEGTLQVDLLCAKCEYNLRGLSSDGRCPECGESVASSLRRDRLLFANPKWLSTIALGQTLIFCALAVIPLLPVVFAILMTTFLWPTGPGFPPVMTVFMLASAVIIGGGIVTGVFLSTRREPALAAPRRTSVARWTARVCALAGMPGVFAGAILSPATDGVSTSGATFTPLGLVVIFLGAAACVIGCASLLLYLGKLAERVPDAKLLRSNRQLTALLCALVPLTLGCLALTWAVLSSNPRPETHFMSGVRTAGIIIPIVLTFAAGVLYWFLMVAFRRSIKRVISVAVCYDTLFGDIPTEEVLGSCGDHRPPTRETRHEVLTDKTGGAVLPSSTNDESSAKPVDQKLCIRCGYNLRGLASDGKCPECGTPIDRSRRGNLLAAADSAWLAGLCRGLTLVVAAIVVHFVGLLFETGASRGIAGLADLAAPIEAVRRGASATLLLIGVVLITRLDPRLALAEHPLVLRTVTRGMATAGLFLYVLALLLTPIAPGVLLASGIKWCFRALLIATIVSASLYLARLAKRIPDEELASSTRSTAIRFAIVFPVFSVSLAIGDGLLHPGLAYVIVRLFFILVAMCSLPFAWKYAFTLVGLWTSTYRKAFRECLAEAQRRDRALTERSVR